MKTNTRPKADAQDNEPEVLDTLTKMMNSDNVRTIIAGLDFGSQTARIYILGVNKNNTIIGEAKEKLPSGIPFSKGNTNYLLVSELKQGKMVPGFPNLAYVPGLKQEEMNKLTCTHVIGPNKEIDEPEIGKVPEEYVGQGYNIYTVAMRLKLEEMLEKPLAAGKNLVIGVAHPEGRGQFKDQYVDILRQIIRSKKGEPVYAAFAPEAWSIGYGNLRSTGESSFVVDVGNLTTGVCMFDVNASSDQTLKGTNVISGKVLTYLMKQALADWNGAVVSPADAEKAKIALAGMNVYREGPARVTVPRGTGSVSIDGRQAAIKTFEKLVDYVVAEIRELYGQTVGDTETKPDKLILAGKGSHIKGIDEVIRKALQIPHFTVEPIDRGLRDYAVAGGVAQYAQRLPRSQITTIRG